MSHTPLYFVELRGSSRQRGLQHGRLLKDPIERAVEFYRSFFRKHIGLDAPAMRQRAALFIEPTCRVSPLLMAEYEGIAEGSGQRLEDIVALSARYEITFETVALGECSNVFVGPRRSQEGHTLLGQSWDWRPEVLDFRAVFIARCDDLPDHIMVTECGQPGKYGFNEYGLGLVSGALSCSEKASIGDHLFVVLGREMLARTNFVDARKVLDQFTTRATFNFLLADAEGNGVDVEEAPHVIVKLDLKPDEVYWHTNHCRQTDEPCPFENSLIRGRRWAELTASPEPITPQAVKSWLADRLNGYESICSTPNPSHVDATTWIQTLCSIVMDLNSRTMWVSDGPSSEHPYQEVGFHSMPSCLSSPN